MYTDPLFISYSQLGRVLSKNYAKKPTEWINQMSITFRSILGNGLLDLNIASSVT